MSHSLPINPESKRKREEIHGSYVESSHPRMKDEGSEDWDMLCGALLSITQQHGHRWMKGDIDIDIDIHKHCW